MGTERYTSGYIHSFYLGSFFGSIFAVWFLATFSIAPLIASGLNMLATMFVYPWLFTVLFNWLEKSEMLPPILGPHQ